MTKSKRILTLALCVIYMFSAAVFAAAEDVSPEAPTVTVEVTDPIAGKVKISGIAPNGEGKVVTLLVTNLAAEDENNDIEDVALALATRVQYQDTVITGAEGRFEKTFMINMDTAIADIADGSVEFRFYAGGEGYEGSQVATGYLWYAPIDAKLAAAKAVVEEADADAAGALIEINKAVFAVEGAIFDELNKTKLATLLKSKVAADLFAGYTDGNEAEYLEEYNTFDTALRLCIALEGFNQSKKAQVISGATIANDELLGLTSYVEAQGTLNTIYTTKIKDASKASVLDGLFGNNVSSAEELQKIFAREILVYGIKANKLSGSGIVKDILTDANIAAAGLDLTPDPGKTGYLELTEKDSANNAIYQSRASLTGANLAAKIKECAAATYVPADPDPTPDTDGNRGNITIGGGNSTPAPVVPTEKFADLTGYDWAKAAILALAEKNIINGVGADKFNPAGTLTREAAAKIICLAVGIAPAAEETAFADVSAGAWYAPYITALNKAGIINGVSETAFGVGNNVTREDFAVMICRALNFTASNDNSFTDKDSISAYALDAVSALYERGIVGGYEDGSFKPKANISRAEGAKIIYGILSK